MAVPSFGAATTMPSQANDEPAAAGGGKNMVHNKQGIDMLHGRIWTKVLRFALPVAATGILEQLFNASGIMIVGNFSQSDGTAAVAAVGSNAPVTGLILNLFIGIALGANVVIANAIGRGSREAVRNAVHTSIVTALIGGVIVAIIGELLAGPLLGMLNVTADVFPLALAYLRIYLIGMPVILLYNFETAIFRSIGDTQAPLAVLAISGVLNVTMGLIFVVLFHWGVSGVATATVIANVVSSMILLYRLVHTDAAIHVDLREFGIDWFTLRQILRIGLPDGVQSAVFAVANIIIQAAINSLGTVVMAASSAAFNIEIIAYYVLNSFSQACATFTGQTMEPNGSDAASACLASAFWRISSPPRPPSPSCCSSAIVCWRCSMRHRRSFPSATPDSSWCSPPTRSACCTRSCPDICAASASHWCRRCSP